MTGHHQGRSGFPYLEPLLVWRSSSNAGDLESFKKQSFVLKEVEYRIKISFRV